MVLFEKFTSKKRSVSLFDSLLCPSAAQQRHGTSQCGLTPFTCSDIQIFQQLTNILKYTVPHFPIMSLEIHFNYALASVTSNPLQKCSFKPFLPADKQ